MGVSRSASTVIAYAMKEYGWSLEKAYSFVKQKRNIAQPNPAFMKQLAEYEGILDARWEKPRYRSLLVFGFTHIYHKDFIQSILCFNMYIC